MSHKRHCPSCNKEWTVPDHVLELFHVCLNGGPNGNGRRRRHATIPSREEHRQAFWDALVAAQGEESIWRPL